MDYVCVIDYIDLLISGIALDHVGTDVYASFGDYKLKTMVELLSGQTSFAHIILQPTRSS